MTPTIIKKKSNLVRTTSLYDVLCGGRRDGFDDSSSRTFHHHPGNQIFHAIVRENKHLYRELLHKTHDDRAAVKQRMLASSIMRAIQHHGGRFLRKYGRHWIELSEEQVLTKTCHALDDHSIHQKSSSTSSTMIVRPTTALNRLSTQFPTMTGQLLHQQEISLPQPVTPIGEDSGASTTSSSIGGSHDSSTITTKSSTGCSSHVSNDDVMSLHVVYEMTTDEIPPLIHVDVDIDDDIDFIFPETTTTPEAMTREWHTISDDDIPALINIDTGDDGADSDIIDLAPLNPYDDYYLSESADFSGLCGDLLELWGQCQRA
jgi:hypothetical protein